MTINSKYEVNTDVPPGSSEEIDITWGTNEPTAQPSQTIVNGNAVTGAELGQAIKNFNTQLTKLINDTAELRIKANE